MTTGNALVSVIIPTYCEEQSIERCLQSVQKQDFQKGKLEIIVVDSHSPDNTRTIAQRYVYKVVDLKDRGVGKARNVGAQEANGELLLFLDADTILDSCFIDEICEVFSDSEVVCVIGTQGCLERFGTADKLFNALHYVLVNGLSALTARLGYPLFPTVCFACRKSVFCKVGGFDESLAIGEDLVFSLKIGKLGKCFVSKKARAYTSLRRFRKSGRTKTYYTYFSNYFKVFILNRKPSIRDFPHITEI